MAMVGMGAADANRLNFLALSRLSGQFLDRLRGLDTLRLFHRATAETATIAVSYTHLDVYKRQVYGNGRDGGCGCQSPELPCAVASEWTVS